MYCFCDVINFKAVKTASTPEMSSLILITMRLARGWKYLINFTFSFVVMQKRIFIMSKK